MIDIDVSKIISEVGESKAFLIENEENKRQRKNIIIFSAVFLFLFVSFTIIFVVLNSKSNKELSSLNDNIKVLESSNDDLLTYEKQAKEIIKRQNSIQEIMNGGANWSYVFEKLEEIVPKNIVFTRLEIASKDNMRVVGTSPDYVELSKLVVAMKDSGYFGNVALNSASLVTNQSGESSVDFSVNFSFIKKMDSSEKKDIAKENVIPENNSNKVEEGKLPANNQEPDTNKDTAKPSENNSENNNQIPTL